MQNNKNHIRFNPLHHFIITPLSLVTIGLAIAFVRSDNGDSLLPWIVLVSAVLLFLIPLIARIYGLKNQDRLIRLEMRQRYFELTGKRFNAKETQLQLGQIIALRFASDEELIGLIDEAIEKKLSNKAIKQKIKNWQADYLRV